MDAFTRRAMGISNDPSPMGGFGNKGPKMFPPMDDVADRMQALEDTNRVLMQELQKTEEQTKNDKATIESQTNEIQQLQERLNHDREKFKSRFDKTAEKYTKELEKLNEENQILKQTLEDQRDTVEKNNKKMAEVMEENQDLSMIKKDLIMNHMSELENLHAKINAANKQLEAQSKLLNVSKSERESKESVYHDEIVQLKKDNDAFTKEIQNQRIRIETLETENKAQAQTIKELASDKTRLQEEYDTNVAIERSSFTSEKEKWQTDMQAMKDSYEKKMQEDRQLFEETLDREINRVKKEAQDEQMKDRDHFESTLEAEINRIKKEASDEQMKDRELFESTLEREINRIKEECAEEQRRFISEFDSRETDYDSKLQHAQAQNIERKKELENLKQSLSKQEADLTERMKTEIKRRDDEIRKLNECRMEMDRRIADKDTTIKERENEVEQMKRKMQECMQKSEESCRKCGTNFQQDRNRLKSTRSQTEESRIASKPKIARVFVARYSYDPRVSSPNDYPETELTFRAGDYILMEETVDEDGYFLGRLLSGEEGYVPYPFVEKVTEYPQQQHNTKHMDRDLRDTSQQNHVPSPRIR